jgi:alpha-tubulin suppressor-like RCC1 family protein
MRIPSLGTISCFTTFVVGGFLMSAVPTAHAAAPTGIVLDTPVATENWPPGALVGTLSAVDADPGDSHLFAFVEGDGSLDNGGFYISGNQLRVLYGVTLDLDTELRDLQIRLRVVDSTSQTFEQAIAITVIDDRTEDFDSDGLNEADEEDLHGTSDNDVDSDNDGVGDGGELAAVPPTSPSNPAEWPKTAVVGWGSSHWGEQASPPGGGVLALATGEVHSLVLKSNGTLDAWGGGNSYGQNNIPPGLTQVVDVAAGGNYWLEDSSHSLALKSDGTVVGWGYDREGDNVVPAGLGQVTAIAAGRSHGVALKSDGTVVTWGYNPHGSIAPPPGLNNVVDVSARGFYSLALRIDGTVVTWGSNFDGVKWVDATSPVGLRDVVAISAGRFHSMALKNDGTVVAWGNNSLGQTNVPPGLSEVVSISAGGFHSMALKQDGTIVTWGSNSHGQRIAAPAALSGVKLISAGILHSLAVIQEQGYPSITSAASIVSTPGAAISHQVTVANALPVSYSAVGLPPGLAIDSQSGLISGVSGATRSSIKIKVETDQGTLSQSAWIGVYEGLPATSISLTPSGFPENSANGTIVGTLVSTDPDEGDTHTYEWVDGPGSTDNQRFRIEGDQIVLNEDMIRDFETNPAGFTIRLRSRDSSLNAFEQAIAISYLDDRSEDVDGDGLTEAQEEDVYFTSDTNLDSDGDGFSDGFEVNRGFLPNSNTSFPNGRITLGWGGDVEVQTVPPSGMESVVSVSAGAVHSLALKADGSILAWGGNDDDQCSIPGGLGLVSGISAGGNHSLALMQDGTVQAWGNNDFMQTTVPSGLAGVVAISAGSKHSLALKEDGTVIAWGDDSDGQCQVPVNLTGVIAVAAGGSHSLSSDGARLHPVPSAFPRA